jgi:hypothetical protein
MSGRFEDRAGPCRCEDARVAVADAGTAVDASVADAPCPRLPAVPELHQVGRGRSDYYRRVASFIERRRRMAAFSSKFACMCIQNCGVVLKSCAKRIAVSAVTPRLPRTSSLSRTVDMPSFCAAAAWVISRGFRNSSSRISPG